MVAPVTRRAWRRWDEVASVFQGPEVAEWESDRSNLYDSPTDPWER